METMDLSEARIYVGTYAKYNNGSLQGEWVELSEFYDLDDFMERCAEIHEDEEEPEYMFQAWEEIPDGLINEGHLDENFFELYVVKQKCTPKDVYLGQGKKIKKIREIIKKKSINKRIFDNKTMKHQSR